MAGRAFDLVEVYLTTLGKPRNIGHIWCKATATLTELREQLVEAKPVRSIPRF